ncbi:MAG: glycosyltransferase [Tenericutes bacterium]|nr:glycosyltransferase [Mycoplasmatota bacterium]
MYIVFLNPQGNFDKSDSFWTEHPDFGGQLVYVKEIAIAMAKLGHKVDIITRKFEDDKLNVFTESFDYYEGQDNVRIVRIECGGSKFLQKELLWEHLNEWTDNIITFFKEQDLFPNFLTGHYGDGGLSAAMLKKKTNIPYSFTGHSLGAQKLEKLAASLENIEQLDNKYYFSKRIEAEREAIKYSNLIFVSTKQEKEEQYTHILYKDITDNCKDKFVVAPPGANTDVFNQIDRDFDKGFSEKFDKICQRDILKTRLALPYVVLASRLDPKKNHIALVNAYAKDKELQKKCNLAISLRGIINAFEDYSFAKADELKILNEIMEVIHKYKLHGKVTFISINSQKELASFYRYMAKRKSIFSLTALYEPFGLAPIEAMSSGLPAVVTMYGGPSDVLFEDNIKYGVLVDVFDEVKIAVGLHEAINNYSEYKKLGIQRVLDKYTWEATSSKYIRSIEEVLNSTKDLENIEINPYFLDSTKSKMSLDFIINKIW